MKTEYATLLAVVRAVLNEQTLPDCAWEGVDTAVLCDLAKQHYLTSFLWRVCYTPTFPAEVRAEVEKGYFATLAQQTEQEGFARELQDFFRTSHIRHMPLKGYVLRRLYPTPDLRVSCDLDVLYDKEYRAELRAFCLAQGFAVGDADAHNDSYIRGTLTFESHHSLSEHNVTVREYYRDVWDRLETEDGLAYRFTPADFYVYMLLHMKKHFYEGNIGVRSILDVFIYNLAHPDMDRGYLDRAFTALELSSFAATVERLSRVWFGGEATNDDMELLGDYVMEGGIAGTAAQKALMTATTSHSGGRVRYIINRIFLPYEVMARRSPTLQKWPILLPAYWVARWWNRLFRGRSIRSYVHEAEAIDRESIVRITRIKQIVEQMPHKDA